MTDADGSTVEVDQLDEYRASPLRFPLHVLDTDGTPLCGTMADDQRRFVDENGLEEQPTLRDRQREGHPGHMLSSLCGNCRRSLFSEDGTDPLQEVWDELQRKIEGLKA